MLRVIAFNVALFALPFVLYAAYIWIRRRMIASDAFDNVPIAYLAGAGLACVIAALLIVGEITGAGPEGIYTPAQLKDGVIVPGKIVKPDETPG